MIGKFLKAGQVLATGLALMLGFAMAQTASAQDYPDVTIKVAHDIAEAHPTHLAMVRWQELLSEATGGKMKIQIFPNAVLGSTDSQMTQLQQGSLDVVVLGGVSLLGKYNEEANIELLPFLFSSNKNAIKALEGEYGDWLAKEIVAPAGFQVMSYMINGLRHVGNNKRPINVPADMEGLKFRVANVALLVEFFKEMNSTAVPMAFTEVFTALQQGTVDGFENPAAVFNSNKFDEAVSHLSLTGHAFTAYVPVMDLEKFNAYPAEVQKVLLDTAKEAASYQHELMYEYEDRSVSELKERGMQVNEVDKDAFVAAVKPIWDRFIEKYGDAGVKLALESQK